MYLVEDIKDKEESLDIDDYLTSLEDLAKTYSSIRKLLQKNSGC